MLRPLNSKGAAKSTKEMSKAELKDHEAGVRACKQFADGIPAQKPAGKYPGLRSVKAAPAKNEKGKK